MKRPAPTALTRRLALPALLFLACIATTHTVLAQDGWKLLDVNLNSGFESEFEWPRPGAYMFWRTEQVGYYRTFTETGPNTLKPYRTTDRGRTWTVETNPDPIPHYFLTGSFAYSPSGHVTRNGGAQWTRMHVSFNGKADSAFFPDTTVRHTVTDLIAATDSVMVAFYRAHDFDEVAQDSVPYGPFRLAASFDAGRTWTFFDYIVDLGSRIVRLDSTTVIGKFPAPEGMTNTIYAWDKLLYMPNDSIVYVSTRPYGNVAGKLANHFYLGKINIRSNVARWIKLPFSEPVPPNTAAPLDFRFITANVAYAIQSTYVDISNPEDIVYTMWRSEDGGENWTEIPLPPWVDYRSLRFVSTTHGVASNGITSDGGGTWTPWAHMFGRNALFYAYDSTDYYLANRFSLFASSTDAGRTWAHNESGGISQTVLAHNGRVFVGRSYQSLMYSADSGDTWVDAGAEGRLPARLSTIVAMGFPDVLFNPNRVVGIATFVEYDGTTHVNAIESNDGGNVWSLGEELPDLADAVGAVRMSFVREPESETAPPVGFIASSKGLFVSTNGGITWSLKNSDHRFEYVAMLDPRLGSAITSTGIYETEDGGSTWRLAQARAAGDSLALGVRAHYYEGRPGTFRSLFSDRAAQHRNWSYKTSLDGGQTWTEQNGTGAAKPMDIGAFWGDTMNVHAVGRGATIQHSDDGGQTFTLKHDAEPEFKLLAGLVSAGQDDKFIYVVTPANQAGRFKMLKQIPVSVPVTPGGPITGLFLTPNPSRGNATVLDLELAERSEVSVRIYDVLGDRVREIDLGLREAGRHREPIEITQLPSGHYRVEVSTPAGLLQAPMVVVQ